MDVQCPPTPRNPALLPPPAGLVCGAGVADLFTATHQGSGMGVSQPSPSLSPDMPCWPRDLLLYRGCGTVADFYFKTWEGNSSPVNHLFPLGLLLPILPSTRLSIFLCEGTWEFMMSFGPLSSQTLSPEAYLQEAPALGPHCQLPGWVPLAPSVSQHMGGLFSFSEATDPLL